MLAMRIIATVFLGLSCFSRAMHTINQGDVDGEEMAFLFIRWAWRAFVIVAIWVI